MALTREAVERAMKVQEVIVRGLSGQLTWLQVADILGRSPRSIRRMRWRFEQRGYDGLYDGRRVKPSPKLSIAVALGFRWDGQQTRFYFQTQPGSYTDVALIAFVRTLKRHFRGRPVLLVWDGLGAHRSGRMKRYLARQRPWLTVEPLPAYAPELNPVECVWGSVKQGELANLCPPDVLSLRRPLHAGFARIRGHPALAFAFLRHAGLML